jgi:hypothetical protein
LQSRSRERDEKKKLLVDGSLLWWRVLLAWFFPFIRHGFGTFLEEEDEKN